jgi:flagellar basal body rod protein FlgG
MNVSLYQAAAAMNASSRWQDVIADNLVAGSTPGSRKVKVSFAAVQAALTPGVSGQRSSSHAIPTVTTSATFQQGPLRPTNLPTDLAVDGPGFLEVQLPNGTHAFTRDGELQFNAQGQLVTKQGFLVLGDGGPLQMDPTNPAQFSVSPSGQISQGNGVKGRLKLLEFNQPGLLTPVGAGCYVANNPQVQSAPAKSSTLRQGYLETANSTPTVEMASLITAMRSFEANQKVMQMQDDRMGRVITDLGSPS